MWHGRPLVRKRKAAGADATLWATWVERGTRRRGGPPPGAAHDRSVNPEVPTGGSLESLEQFTVSWYLHRHWRIRCKVFHKRQSSTVNQNSPFRKERATRPAPLFWLSDCLITRAAIRTGRRANAEGDFGGRGAQHPRWVGGPGRERGRRRGAKLCGRGRGRAPCRRAQGRGRWAMAAASRRRRVGAVAPRPRKVHAAFDEGRCH
jgi:hypothetical protein